MSVTVKTYSTKLVCLNGSGHHFATVQWSLISPGIIQSSIRGQEVISQPSAMPQHNYITFWDASTCINQLIWTQSHVPQFQWSVLTLTREHVCSPPDIFCDVKSDRDSSDRQMREKRVQNTFELLTFIDTKLIEEIQNVRYCVIDEGNYCKTYSNGTKKSLC